MILGEILGCGAHVTYLRRTGVARYPYEKMVTLEQLEALLEQAREQDIEPSANTRSIVITYGHCGRKSP